jgi:hypothetical protein
MFSVHCHLVERGSFILIGILYFFFLIYFVGVYFEGAVRFGYKVHSTPMQPRTPQSRYEAAQYVFDENEARAEEDFRGTQLSRNGIFGFPVLKESRSFHGSLSFVPDIMHVVLLGFLKSIVEIMCRTCSNVFNLRRNKKDGFKGSYKATMKMSNEKKI